MIKNVFLDLDDTLLDFHKAEAVAVRVALSEAEIDPTDEIIARYSEINAMQWRLLEDGLVTREQVLINRFKVLFSEIYHGVSLDEIAKQAEKIRYRYEYLLSQGHYFIDGATELLEELYGKYDLYMASNGTAVVQDRRIDSSGISKYFKEIFISERVGCDKPQIGFFEYCFDKIPDFKKEETIIIGDSLSSDMKGGDEANIYTCWFNPKRKEKSMDVRIDFEISKLSEIPHLLEKCGQKRT